MFCIAAFIILALLSIFSAKYRTLAKQAWSCVAKKTTFRKCDTNFKNEAKSKLLGGLTLSRPKLAKFIEKWLDVLAFIFVILTIWSLVIAVKSGLNLFVHGTCNPANSESCSLGTESCSIETNTPSFYTSLKSGDILDWTKNEIEQFTNTISKIPDKFKTWNPDDYLSENNTYYHSYDENKPTAVEVIDPSCQFCKKLFFNLKEANVQNDYNLTYILFPIPDSTTPTGYKFRNSYLLSSYIEAIKLTPLDNTDVPADWQILEKIFTSLDSESKIEYQTLFVYNYNHVETENTVNGWLKEIGYTDEQIDKIYKDKDSEIIRKRLLTYKNIVQNEIDTVKIPTLIIGENRYDGVVSADKLR